jgi:hypothetical protein
MAPCYFYKWEQHIQGADMAVKVYEWLTALYGVPRKPENHVWQTSDLIQAFRDVSPRLGDGRLVILLDALDEAEEASEAVKWVPTGKLPAGIFVVVTSRPAASLNDHLLPLARGEAEKREDLWLETFDLAPGSAENRADLLEYFEKLLGEVTTDSQRQRLVDASGGFFRIAANITPRLLKRPKEERSVAVENLLERSMDWAGTDEADTIFRFYQSDIQRTLAPEQWELLPDFARLLVAARDWLGEKEAEAILRFKARKEGVSGRRWDTGSIEALSAALTWLLQRELQPERDGREQWCFKYQHKSVRDFLVSTKHRGPARTGVREMVASMVRYYLARAKKYGWAEAEFYGRCHVVRHLLEMGEPIAFRRAAELLTSPDYLQATLGDQALGEKRPEGHPDEEAAARPRRT